MHRFLRSAAATAAIALAFAFSNSFAVGILLGTGGFEDRPTGPDFQTGDLEGQNGWSSAGTASTATIVELDGQQSVLVNHNDVDRRWYVPAGIATPSGRYVSISWDMAVSVSQSPGLLGPFFGLETYAGDGGFTVLGTLGVDASTGEVLIQEGGTGFLITTGSIVTNSEWNNFVIELDYVDDVYRSYLNGDLISTEAFVDDSPTNELDTFSDADIATFRVASSGGTGVEGPDAAALDNLLVFDGILGDYNTDGTVDLADYTIWRNNLGSEGLAVAADGTGDGVVDVQDYLVWKLNYGRTNAMSGTLSATAVVPEPVSVALLLTGAGVIGLIRRFVRQ